MPKIIIELSEAQFQQYQNALKDFSKQSIEGETLAGISLELKMFSHIWNQLILKTYVETDLGEVEISFESE